MIKREVELFEAIFAVSLARSNLKTIVTRHGGSKYPNSNKAKAGKAHLPLPYPVAVPLVVFTQQASHPKISKTTSCLQ